MWTPIDRIGWVQILSNVCSRWSNRVCRLCAFHNVWVVGLCLLLLFAYVFACAHRWTCKSMVAFCVCVCGAGLWLCVLAVACCCLRSHLGGRNVCASVTVRMSGRLLHSTVSSFCVVANSQDVMSGSFSSFFPLLACSILCFTIDGRSYQCVHIAYGCIRRCAHAPHRCSTSLKPLHSGPCGLLWIL